MRIRLVCHLLALSLVSVRTEAQLLRGLIDYTPEVIKDVDDVVKDWKKLENVIKSGVNEAVKALMPMVMDNIHDVNISSSCIRDAFHLFAGIRKLQTWALRFLDSSAKGLDGGLTGALVNYGSYDECVDTVAINQRSGKRKGEVMFTGKYCIVRIKPSLPPKKGYYKVDEVLDEFKGIYKKETIMGQAMRYAQFLYFLSIRLGLCVPSGCSADDINHMLAKVANFTSLYMNIKRCEVKENPTYTPLKIFVITLYSFAGFLVLLGSMIDLYCSYTRRKLTRKSLRLLLIFSFVSNFRKFVDTSTSSKYLSCLNGIRFLTMAWVILGHSYLIQIHQIATGLEYIKYMMQEFATQVIVNGTLSVETFFFLSGLLVCYVTVNHVVIAKREFNVKVYIIHRLFRILPAYIFVVLFVFILDVTVAGPMAYSALEPFLEGCRKNWWTNFLFINNFYKSDDMCMPHGWFLSIDMQFYIGALIILLPLFRWPKVGISIAAASIISFIISTAVVTYIGGFPPSLTLSDPNAERADRYLVDFYMKPYPHGSSYGIGILVGYILATKPKLHIPRIILWFGWSAAIVCTMAAVYGTYEWNAGKEPTVWEALLYGSLHRPAWIVGVAWMVVCCANGYGGVVNYILSWKVWIPLGRLTFMAYLVHPLVQTIFYSDVRNTFQPRKSVGVWAFFGHLMATYGVAFVGSMLIESPLIALEKVLLPRDGGEIEKKNEKENEDRLRMNEATNVGMMCLTNNAHVSQSYNGNENPAFISRL